MAETAKPDKVEINSNSKREAIIFELETRVRQLEAELEQEGARQA